MKKFLSILMLFALLLSMAACGSEETTTPTQETTQATEPATEATEPAVEQKPGVHVPTAEEMYGHINQMEPIDGVYKIWNAEGVKNIINHPDAKFELLCTIDMEGAVLAPIGADKPFTGELKGANFFIKNFTVQGGDEESFGFISVNQGTVRNLVLANVTFIPGPNAKNIGSLAGDNQGQILRCNVNSSTMTVETAPEGTNCGSVVGLNSGELANGIVWVDLAFNSEAAANVGGIVGTANGGTVEFMETDGKLDIVGTNKNYGLFAGIANDVVLKNCIFVGATNFAGGERFINFTGNPNDNEREVALKALWRDNEKPELTEAQNRVRDRVVAEMNAMATVEWHLRKDLPHACTCSLSVCHGVYNTTYTYKGIPYNHKGGSLERMNYLIGEDGYLVDWVYDLESYDGFDIYIGADCSSTVQQAWWAVSNSTNLCNTNYIPPAYNHGTIAVGDYICDFEMTKQVRDGVNTIYTAEYLEANEEQVIYESYAAARPGDAIVNRVAAGGHTRMVAENPVIIRNQAGQIDPTYSYLITHEQGATWTDDVNMVASSCKVNWQYTFAALYGDAYIPVTCEELLTGEMEPAEAELQGKCDGFGGMLTGTVKANYQLDYVTLTITNAKGEVILDHPMFTTCQKNGDYGGAYFTARYYTDYMDMAEFAVVLSRVGFESGQTYNYTVTANLSTFDNIPVHEGSFTYGG